MLLYCIPNAVPGGVPLPARRASEALPADDIHIFGADFPYQFHTLLPRRNLRLLVNLGPPTFLDMQAHFNPPPPPPPPICDGADDSISRNTLHPFKNTVTHSSVQVKLFPETRDCFKFPRFPCIGPP